MRRSIFLLLLAVTLPLSAINKVSLTDLNNGGWQRYQGQYVQITTPLMVIASMYDSLILAPERLFAPEEHAEGLAQRDSTEYYQIKRYNDSLRIRLDCKFPYSLNLGATVQNLKVLIVGEKHLQSGQQPPFHNYRPSRRVPAFKGADLLVCVANVENYFYTLGGYATKKVTRGQHALQSYKVASALVRINADIYCLEELQWGNAAPAELTATMNALCHKERYAYIKTEKGDYNPDTISVGYIYRKDRVSPSGPLRYMYGEKIRNVYAHRFLLQGFTDLHSGEQFVISANHPKSKRGGGFKSNIARCLNILQVLTGIETAYKKGYYSDPDILLVGDFNAYGKEESVLKIVGAGYTDLVAKYDSLDYSYSYQGEVGFLDRAYASPTMLPQVIGVKPIHWNTDFHYSGNYRSKYNYKNRNIPQDAPADIRKAITGQAERDKLFRYSDHDPLLIGIKLGTR